MDGSTEAAHTLLPAANRSDMTVGDCGDLDMSPPFGTIGVLGEVKSKRRSRSLNGIRRIFFRAFCWRFISIRLEQSLPVAIVSQNRGGTFDEKLQNPADRHGVRA